MHRWTSRPSWTIAILLDLLMTNDGMRHIRLFQIGDLFLSQFNGQSADGIFQMRNLGCPDDRRGHRFLLQQPGKRNMSARNAMLFRDFGDPLHDPLIGFGCRIVFAFCDLIGFGTQRVF